MAQHSSTARERTAHEDAVAGLIYPLVLAEDSVWRFLRRHSVQPRTALANLAVAASTELIAAKRAARSYVPFDPSGL